MGSPVLLSESKTEQYNLKSLSPSGRRVAPPLPTALRGTWSMFHRRLQVYISRRKPIERHSPMKSVVQSPSLKIFKSQQDKDTSNLV